MKLYLRLARRLYTRPKRNKNLLSDDASSNLLSPTWGPSRGLVSGGHTTWQVISRSPIVASFCIACVERLRWYASVSFEVSITAVMCQMLAAPLMKWYPFPISRLRAPIYTGSWLFYWTLRVLTACWNDTWHSSGTDNRNYQVSNGCCLPGDGLTHTLAVHSKPSDSSPSAAATRLNNEWPSDDDWLKFNANPLQPDI